MADGSRRSVLLVAPTLNDNSLGRVQCLSQIFEALGWAYRVGSVDDTGELWAPVRDTEFAQRCARRGTGESAEQSLTRLARASDLIVAVKPLPASLGVAYPISVREGIPLIADVDDPDIEIRATWTSRKRRVRRRLSSSYHRDLLRLRRLAIKLPTLVSNPVLQQIYGGLLVPHARPTVPAERVFHSDSRAPVVRFVGSIRGHKGVDTLRGAVARLAESGYTLEVTSDRPDDGGRPWERWLGATSVRAGIELVRTADLICVPSLDTSWSRGQLPAKLLDAMIMGKAIVASSLPPISWALGSSGIEVPPGDEVALAEGLARLRDPAARRMYGDRAKARADAEFSIEVIASRLHPVLTEMCR